jgi:uncharacterized protein (UPF0276 family)
LTQPLVGFVVQPDRELLARLWTLMLEEVDLFEVAPETLWKPAPDGGIAPNGYHRECLRLKALTNRPFVAHGVGFSVGTAFPGDRGRRDRWLDQIRRDAEQFELGWYSDHLGVSHADGRNLTLPLPLPPSTCAVERVRGHLAELAAIVPDVGVENTVTYFLHGSPEQDAVFARSVAGNDRWLVLDLHNVHTMAANLGFDLLVWLAHLDLSRVIEVHVSGGEDSPPEWLGGRSLRLDSHSSAIPEPVWELLALVGPRCPNLRAVVLERMEGTVEDGDVPVLRAELRRIRAAIAGWTGRAPPIPLPGPALWAALADPVAFEREMADRVLGVGVARVDPSDGERMAALLVARLRFERLLNGSDAASRAFETDPAAFAARFKRWHREVPPTALFPADEGKAWK